MKVSELLVARRENWRKLEELCSALESRSRRKIGAPAIARFAALYRSACADLALAESYQLPPATVHYLHQLVGRAHNQLYRSQRFKFKQWGVVLLYEIPQRLFRDNCLRLAFLVFWGGFLISMYLASAASPLPEFAEWIVTAEGLVNMEAMYRQPHFDRDLNQGSAAVGYYISHNASIGIQVFAWGLLFGVGGLFVTLYNGFLLGAVFGHMTTLEPQREHFFHFVTAHGPFELTAIVLSAAAGMRLGFSIVFTQGFSRSASLQRAGRETMPLMGAAVILFVLAALLEGFISPSSLPYEVKALVSVVSSGLLMAYFVLLGYPRTISRATGT